MQSKREPLHPGMRHLAIIMDGNGRWAAARGLPRRAGHAAGARAVSRVVAAARRLGVPILTLYAFSGDNWGRPLAEVEGLMRLFRRYLEREAERCRGHGIRLRVIGRRDRLPDDLLAAIAQAEASTAGGTAMTLRIAVDYSARDAIVRAAAAAGRGGSPLDRAAFAARIGDADHAGGPAHDVDLLIRTGGEQRLSDFLLWECAYAELRFTARMWPDFDAHDLATALADFGGRERRFGLLPGAVAERAAGGKRRALLP